MKSLIVIASLFAFSASAGIELRGKFERTNCTIKDNKVIRIQAFGKDNAVGFTQVTEINTFGLAEILAKVEASARPTTTGADPDYVYEATVDGRKFSLNLDDSKEAMAVIQMLVKACRFN